MNEDEMHSRLPWSENADWVWDRRRNRRLRRTATLRASLRSSTTDLDACVTGWLEHLESEGDGVWYWGGFSCSVKALDVHSATLELSSSGEDAFESLVHASQWFHRDLVAAHTDVRVRWDELPLE